MFLFVIMKQDTFQTAKAVQVAPLGPPMEELYKNVDVCGKNQPQASPKREGRLSCGILAPAGVGGIAFLSRPCAEMDGLWQSWVEWAGFLWAPVTPSIVLKVPWVIRLSEDTEAGDWLEVRQQCSWTCFQGAHGARSEGLKAWEQGSRCIWQHLWWLLGTLPNTCVVQSGCQSRNELQVRLSQGGWGRTRVVMGQLGYQGARNKVVGTDYLLT